MVQQHPSAVVFPGGEAMAAMAARAVAAVRRWDASVTAEHGPEAVWLACSHGDVIKAIVADALGMHLDLFQRIVADPASVTAIRYTADAAVRAPAQRHRRRPVGPRTAARSGGGGRRRAGAARPSAGRGAWGGGRRGPPVVRAAACRCDRR